MSKFFYGSYEKILRAYITPNITQENLANTLLLSPRISKENYQENKDDVWASDHIDKGNVSKFCKGTRQITQALLDDHLKSNALENIEYSFLTEIVPRIPINSRASIKKEIVSQICQDDGVSEEEKLYYKETSIKKELCTFLVETYMFAVTGISMPMKALTKPKCTNLPSQNRFFCGRKDLLKIIRERYQSGFHVQRLYGASGIGKTQIALQYAHTYSKEYTLVWWINAENKLTIRRSILDLLLLQGHSIENSDDESIQQAFRDYCTVHNGWLLIYDNAEYETNIDYETLDSYFPEDITKGDILITTQCKNAFIDTACEKVDIFTELEAISFLECRSGIEDNLNAIRLAKQLDFHPLALEYAAAYIRETPDVDYVSYSKKFEEYSVKLLDRKVGNQPYQRTVREAFHITLDKMIERASTNPYSKSIQQFLNICAFLAPNDIEFSVFFTYNKDLPEPLKSVLKDELKRDELTSDLTRYSLLYLENGLLSIHSLLQAVLFDEIDKNKKSYWMHISYSTFNNYKDIVVNTPPYTTDCTCLISSFIHVQSIFRKYILYCRKSNAGTDFEICHILRLYTYWVTLPLISCQRYASNDLANIAKTDICNIKDVLSFFKNLSYDRSIYFAYLLHYLGSLYYTLNDNQEAIKYCIQAVNLTSEIMDKTPINNLLWQDTFWIAALIFYVAGMKAATIEDYDMMWRCYISLIDVYEKFLTRLDIDMDISIGINFMIEMFSSYVGNSTQKPFVLQIQTSKNRLIPQYAFLHNQFGFYYPIEDGDAKCPNNFDILLDSCNGELAVKDLNHSWVTLAFMKKISSYNEMLYALLEIDTKRLNMDARRSLYSAIFQLAQRLGKKDIMSQYKKLLKIFP